MSQELKQNFSKDSEFLIYSNVSNFTWIDESWKEILKPIVDYMMLSILIVLMLAAGSEVSWINIWVHIKQPINMIIGLTSQFFLNPLCAYLLIMATGINGLHAIGVLIIACGSAGTLSNTFTYYSNGDLGLSIAMTTTSTVTSLGLMPGNLWLYGRHFESSKLVIPYKRMTLSLISITSPIVVGMLLKWKFPTFAKNVSKVSNMSGLVILFVCLVVELIVFPSMFKSVPAKVYIIILILPVFCFTIGYTLAIITRRPIPIRRTIALECGIQNVPLAITIIALSFPQEVKLCKGQRKTFAITSFILYNDDGRRRNGVSHLPFL